MRKQFEWLRTPVALLLSMGLAGCTLFPDKNPPTLASTTSAEQRERILWQMAQKQQWGKLSPLLSATTIWHVNGEAMGRDQVVPYLQSLNLKDAVLSGVSVQPNGPDMTVSYTLQLSAADGKLLNFSVFSVWQQVKGGAQILVAHSQQERAASSTAAPSATVPAATPSTH